MRILVAAHNHPALHPGGTEIFAHDLFRAYQRAGHEALFLGATNQIHRQVRPGTSFQGLGDAPDEVLLWSGHFDRFYMSQVDLYGVVPDLVELLSRETRIPLIRLNGTTANRMKLVKLLILGLIAVPIPISASIGI